MQAAAGRTDAELLGGVMEGPGTDRKANYPLLAAAVLVMSAVVVLFNHVVWRWCYRLSERRFSVQRCARTRLP